MVVHCIGRNKMNFCDIFPGENLQRGCKTNEGKGDTLDFLINAYVEHLEHHLRQVVTYW